MGIPAWVWFIIAAAALVGGFALLASDRAQRTARNRERRRWAALRGWQFAETDHVLPTRWHGGAIAYYGTGVAKDVVAGSTFTADGRRQVYVADHETNGKVNSVLVAVRCRRPIGVLIELWLPSVPFQHEQMPDLLGPLGPRYAFVSDLAAARALITPDLVDAAEEIGGDVTVLWLEDEWVLAAAPPHSSPSRLERLLRDLGELADVVDPLDADAEEHPQARHEQRQRPQPDQDRDDSEPDGPADRGAPNAPRSADRTADRTADRNADRGPANPDRNADRGPANTGRDAPNADRGPERSPDREPVVDPDAGRGPRSETANIDFGPVNPDRDLGRTTGRGSRRESGRRADRDADRGIDRNIDRNADRGVDRSVDRNGGQPTVEEAPENNPA